MFSIGDFARHGRVSVRMLRHYDAIGLLRPARVDPATGYRSYQADQLARLNRIVALKDLGFTLEQVGSMLDKQVTGPELRGMLRLRHAELAAQIEADTARLRQVEARLSAIESEGRMPSADVQIKTLPAVRVAELTATAAGYSPEHITPVIQPLYGDLIGRLARAGVPITGHGIAYYTSRSWTCPASRRRRWCTGDRWTTCWELMTPWRIGLRPTDTPRPGRLASSTSPPPTAIRTPG